jgi:hypothetical protein
LQLCFDDVAFTVDLVAAFADPASSELVLIADRGEGAWERSNTRTLKRVVGERNQETGDKLVHQVRMMKEFKAENPELEDMCGLAIESVTFGAVDKQMSHARAVAATLRYAAGAVRGRVLDPTGVDDLAAKWSKAQRQAFSAAFARGADRAEEALRLEGDARLRPRSTSGRRCWVKTSKPAAQSEAETIEGLVAGSITSTGRATTSRYGAEPGRPTPSWRSS